MARWIVSGRNRRVGAIGAFEGFWIEVEAKTLADALQAARDARYAAGFEHVDRSTASRIHGPKES